MRLLNSKQQSKGSRMQQKPTRHSATFQSLISLRRDLRKQKPSSPELPAVSDFDQFYSLRSTAKLRQVADFVNQTSGYKFYSLYSEEHWFSPSFPLPHYAGEGMLQKRYRGCLRS